jgi:hypothetical protein
MGPCREPACASGERRGHGDGWTDVSENLELARRSLELTSGWDVDPLLGLHDADVEFLPLTGTRLETGVPRPRWRTSLHGAGAALWDFAYEAFSSVGRRSTFSGDFRRLLSRSIHASRVGKRHSEVMPRAAVGFA